MYILHYDDFVKEATFTYHVEDTGEDLVITVHDDDGILSLVKVILSHTGECVIHDLHDGEKFEILDHAAGLEWGENVQPGEHDDKDWGEEAFD